MTHRPHRYRASNNGPQQLIHDFLESTLTLINTFKDDSAVFTDFIILNLPEAWFTYQGVDWYLNHVGGKDFVHVANLIKQRFDSADPIKWPTVPMGGDATHSMKGTIVNGLEVDFAEPVKKPLETLKKEVECTWSHGGVMTTYQCPHCKLPCAPNYMGLHRDPETFALKGCQLVIPTANAVFNPDQVAALHEMRAQNISLAKAIDQHVIHGEVVMAEGVPSTTPSCLPWHCVYDADGHILCTNVHDPTKQHRFVTSTPQSSHRSDVPEEGEYTYLALSDGFHSRTASQTPLPDGARSGSTEYPSTSFPDTPQVRAVTESGGRVLSFQNVPVTQTPSTMKYSKHATDT